jgi:hypothetical protein
MVEPWIARRIGHHAAFDLRGATYDRSGVPTTPLGYV